MHNALEMKQFGTAARKALAAVTIALFAFGTFSVLIPKASAAVGDTAQITITKFMDGVPATVGNAGGATFPMIASGSTGGNPLNTFGPASYSLSPAGYPSDTPPNTAYQAQTGGVMINDNYTTYEDTTGAVVGATCDTTPYSLVGYTTGDTYAEAAAGTPTATVPNFVGLTGPKYVIVWNHDCAVVVPPAQVTVTINKFVDGVQATAVNANSADFPMVSTTTAANLNGGAESSGNYQLNVGDSYEAMTSAMDVGANYATNEIMDGTTVAASCSSDQPFTLVGYTSGSTYAAAAAAVPSMTAPSFTGLTENKYVIVWNHDCSVSSGDMGGDVDGGVSPQGTLAVTSIEATDTTATANDTYESGWSYTFNITVPDSELNLSMKFANWFNASASSTIAAGGNMQISSAQADNAGVPVPVTAANTYTTPALHMTGDLNPGMPGKQVKVVVQVKMPASTVNGSYTTSYGLQTQP